MLLSLSSYSFSLCRPSASTHKDTYSQPCSDLWAAVKDTISNPGNYTIQGTPDDARMTASYNVKHAVHLSISGAVAQRTNVVTLVSNGTGCEMQVESSFSGLSHDDAGDFKKRVDESLAKLNAAKPPDPAKVPDAK